MGRHYGYIRPNETGVFEAVFALGCAAVVVVLSIAITAAPFLIALWFAKEIGLF